MYADIRAPIGLEAKKFPFQQRSKAALEQESTWTEDSLASPVVDVIKAGALRRTPYAIRL